MKITKRVYLKDMKPEDIIQRLNNGGVIYCVNKAAERFSCKLVGGIICAFDEDGDLRRIGGVISYFDNTYFEDEEEILQLELYKRYRTRGGRLVIIVEHRDEPFIWPWVGYFADTKELVTYKDDGLACLTGCSPDDIVAEWEDMR